MGTCPDDVHSVLCAPTGKAAYNIGGHTIHSLFCIPANQSLHYKPLDSQQLDTMRVKFQSLKLIFIDEVSMVGGKMFNFINHRLQEVFASNLPFGGRSIIAIGDLYQLKPVLDNWIFADLQDNYGPLATHLWKDFFHIYELTEIMRQKEDKSFAELLNRLREGIHTEGDMDTLQSRIMKGNQVSTPDLQTPHLFTTNKEVTEFNKMVFNQANVHSKCTITAVDTLSGDSDTLPDIKSKILGQIPDDPSKTMGLFKSLDIAENVQAEICVNVDVEDGLTNGSPCVVKKLDFRVHDSARCSIIWDLFHDTSIGIN